MLEVSSMLFCQFKNSFLCEANCVNPEIFFGTVQTEMKFVEQFDNQLCWTAEEGCLLLSRQIGY